MKSKLIIVIGLVMVQWFFSKSFLQSYDNNWLLGYGFTYTKEKPFEGLSIFDFSRMPASVTFINDKSIPDLLLFYDYSCISDYQGNFKYYTNGCKILNNSFRLMQNGDSINPGPIWNGSDGTYYPVVNGTMFLPHPSDTNLYYLFHKGSFQGIKGIGGYNFTNVLYYSLIDSRLDNGLGGVIEKNKVIISDTLNESQTSACRHANGRDWWIPVRHGDKNLYYLYLLDPWGVHLDHTQSIGLKGPGHEDTFNGNACFSPDGTKYASCLREDYVQLFDFDRCSGTFSNPVHLSSIVKDSNSFFSYASCVCFSPNTRFLYFNDNYRLIQYDCQSMDIKLSEELITVWDTFIYKNSFTTDFFQTRLAPDGKIYMSIFSGSNIYLHRINNPDRKGRDCNFIQRDIELPNWHSGILPYFPNFRLGPVIGSLCDSLYKVNPQNDITIGPNPAQDRIFIKFNKVHAFEVNLELNLYTIEGKLVQIFKNPKYLKDQEIDIQYLPSGIYIFSLSIDGQQRLHGKVIKI